MKTDGGTPSWCKLAVMGREPRSLNTCSGAFANMREERASLWSGGRVGGGARQWEQLHPSLLVSCAYAEKSSARGRSSELKAPRSRTDWLWAVMMFNSCNPDGVSVRGRESAVSSIHAHTHSDAPGSPCRFPTTARARPCHWRLAPGRTSAVLSGNTASQTRVTCQATKEPRVSSCMCQGCNVALTSHHQ